MANADISLLFGVLGEGSLSGESGKLIQDQLTQIMTELNKSPLKVKVGIDTGSGGKRSWSSQLQQKLDQVSASGKFSAQISTLKLSPSAVSDFKKQLTAIVNTVGLSTGTQITITAEGVGEVKSKLKEAQDGLERLGSSASEAAGKVSGFHSKLAGLSSGFDSSGLDKISKSLQTVGVAEQDALKISEDFGRLNGKITDVSATWLKFGENQNRVLQVSVTASSGIGESFKKIIQYQKEATESGERWIEVQKGASHINYAAKEAAIKKQVAAEEDAAWKAYNAWKSAEDKKESEINRAYQERQAALDKEEARIAAATQREIAQYNKAEDAIEAAVRKQVAQYEQAERQKTIASQMTTEQIKNNLLAIEVLQNRIRQQLIPAEKVGVESDSTSSLREQSAALSSLSKQLAAGSVTNEQFDATMKNARLSIDAASGSLREQVNIAKAFIEAEDSVVSAQEAAAASENEALKFAKSKNDMLRRTQSLLTQVTQAQKNWTAAQNGISKDSYARLGDISSDLNSLITRLHAGAISTEEFNKEFSALSSAFVNVSGSIRTAGENTKTFSERMGGLASKFASWLTVSQVIMRAIRVIRQMITATKELDAALTQISIVTGATGAELEKFASNAAAVAKSIGASVSDIVKSTETFARLGYTLQDSLSLANVTGQYANVAATTLDDATSSLTSIMKAFNIQAGDMELVVDMLVKVGQEYAVSASELGVALQNGASALEAGGNSLEQSIALIAAGNAAVQDASAVGNALKTTSMRIRSSTAELEEMGEAVDDIVKSASTYRKEILALSGVDIMANPNTYKSTYEVLRQIADVWDDLSDIQQATLLEDLAGKRNANTIKSIITNLKDLEGAYDAANNAAGTLAAANETYMQSIEAKLDQFSANFQQFSNSVISSDLIKGVVDFGSALVSVLTVLSDINLLLPLIIASLVTYKSLKLAESANQIAARLVAEKTATESLVISYQSLNAAQRARVMTTLEEAVATKQLTADEYRDITAKLGLATATTGVKVATDGLNVSIKSLLLSNPVGWIILAISLVPTLIGLFQRLHKSNDELIRDAQELKNEYSTTFTQMGSDLQTLRSLETEFERLSRGVDDYGNNISLSANEYERYQEIVETILGISPELIDGYNAEGKAIANKNGLLERSISLMEQEQRLKFKEYYSDDNFKTIAKGLVADVEDELNKVASVPSSLAYSGVKILDNGKTQRGFVHNIQDYIQDAIGVEYDTFNDTLTTYIQKNADLIEENIGEILNNAGKVLVNDAGKWDALSEDQIAEMKDYILSITRTTKQATTELNQELQDVPRSLSSYYDLSDAQKLFLSEYINTFKMTADTTEKDILKMKSDIQDFTDYLANDEDLKATVDLGISLQIGTDVDGNELSVEEYERYVRKLLKDINGFDEDVQVYLRTVLKIDEDDNQIKSDITKAIRHAKNLLQDEFDSSVDELSVKDVLKIYYNISAEPNSLTFDELKKKLEYLAVDWDTTVNVWDFSSVVDGLSDIESSVSDVASAMNTLKSGTALTVEELAKLATKYPDLLKASDLFTDTSIENQQELLNSILGSYEAEYDALIDTKIAELTATNELIQNQIELENEKKNKVIEIADLQANGKLDSEAKYQMLLNELHDLEGQNFVTYSDGVLEVNEEMLNKMLEQQSDEVDSTKPIWGALGDMIIEGHSDGLTGALQTFPQYLTKLKSWAGNSLKTLLGNIATNIGKALSGDTDFVKLTDGVQNLGKVSVGGVTIETQIEGNYTIDGKSVDDWAAEYKENIEKRVETLTEQITANQTIISNLEKMKGLDLKSLYGKPGSTTRDGGSGDGDDAKEELEEYIADIDAYYEALKRLEAIQIRLASLQSGIENAGSEREKIALTQQLIGVYRDEIDALETLNSLRSETIRNSISDLEALGFEIDYNSETNEFMVRNLEHLNELEGDTQEETNELRESTEELINTLDDLNAANQDGVNSLRDFRSEIQKAKQNVIDYLKDLVTTASDAVDEIQNVFDVLKAAADEFAENGGFISVDAFQKIIDLGPQYMQYLRDENGLLIINEESINRVIEAKVRQLAAEQALTYVERLRLAIEEDSIENLDTLLFATTKATDATFGLAYAQLELMHNMGDLNDSQYAAALHNIQAIEDLANTTIAGIGKVSGEYSKSLQDELENMKSGLDDILKYVMDMLKHRIQQQIDALEDMKDAYGEIIDLRKEALDTAKKEAEYEDKVAEKVKQIAKLQEKINALSLDDSRDAQAQKAKLEEELAELQKELADEQNDYAVDAQKEALDDMEEAYKKEKDAEIKALEQTISSYQKLYDMAIDYIENHWNTLYDELIAWNTEYGSVLNSEITTAWENCLAAAQRYGSYVSALNSIDSDIAAAASSSSSSSSNNTIVGTSGNNSGSSTEDSIHAIIKEMYANSQAWSTADSSRRSALDKRNLQLGSMLSQYGINATRGSDGAWYVDGGERLYDKYRKYIYHKGGIAGDNPTLKQNEIMAVLERGEAVLDKQKEEGLYRLVEFATTLSDKFAELVKSTDMRQALTGNGGLADAKSDVPTNISDNHEVHIEFGDTYITGANEETVEKHKAITRQQANELLSQLNIKR